MRASGLCVATRTSAVSTTTIATPAAPNRWITPTPHTVELVRLYEDVLTGRNKAATLRPLKRAIVVLTFLLTACSPSHAAHPATRATASPRSAPVVRYLVITR